MKCNLCKKDLIKKDLINREIINDRDRSIYRFAIALSQINEPNCKYYLCECCWEEFWKVVHKRENCNEVYNETK